ncbi:hypothetical protein ACEWY4_019306 [Coilia grayii]|uniref:Gypsy retrotransposon integrase-like protein 1 n=1 Tax=Coilia grayii TaxID=363190 RepID=A0ABD1JIN6_9TELE
MDLLTALQFDITKHSILSSTPPSALVQHTHTTHTVSKGITNYVHKVKLRPEIPPVQQKLRRLPFSIRADVATELMRMEQEGIIKRIDSSPWVSPMLLMKKKSGQLRLCADLREVNKAVVIDSHPLPHIEEVFHELRGAQMVSTIDLQSAYHQLPLHADSISPLLSVMKVSLHDTGLKLNMSKCHFRKRELPFLGHIISAAGLRPDNDHIKAVADAPTPPDAPALRSFLGLTPFYQKFIPNYVKVVETLRALLRKDYSERKYSTIEKEALACVWATECWRTYLWGNHFTLWTDHSPLTTLLTSKGLGRAGMRIARWSARLLTFNYTIGYKRGCDNVIADCLSRLPLPDADMTVEPDTEIVALMSDDFAAVTAAELSAACKDCPVLQQVRTYMQNGWPRTHKGLDPAIQPYYRIQTELSEHGDCIIRGTHRVVVPPELQSKLIHIAHNTHQGIVRTKQRLRELYWLPGMDTYVQAAIKSCVTCAQHDKTAVVKAAPLTPVSLPDGAWEKLTIDIVSPYLHAPPDCRYAITLVDYYSKWPEVAFTSDVTSSSVIKFLSTVFSREGNPLELVTDNGSVDTVRAKQVKVKEYTDRRRSAQASTFKVGDFVRIKKPVLIRKGAHKFTPPFQITALKGPATFLLSDGKVWNASHLAFAPPDTVPMTLNPQQSDQALPAAVPTEKCPSAGVA